MNLKETLDSQFPGWFAKNKQVKALMETEVLNVESLPHYSKIELDKKQKLEKAVFHVFVTVNPDGRVCKNF